MICGISRMLPTSKTSLLWVVVSSWLLSLGTATLVGDEVYADKPHGRFWVFHSTGISVVKPDDCTIDVHLDSFVPKSAFDEAYEADQEDFSLPTQWRDGVYMERYLPGKLPEDHDNGWAQFPVERLVAINSGVTKRVAVDGESMQYQSEVLVFDTSTNSKFYEKYPTSAILKARVPVGGDPSNMVYLSKYQQIWTHSNTEQSFHVIDFNHDDVQKIPAFKLRRFTTGDDRNADVDPNEGAKLLWNENLRSTEIGFVIAVDRPTVFVVDVTIQAVVERFDYSKFLEHPNTCVGAASIAFSRVNQHLYLQCVESKENEEIDRRDSGILEINVADPLLPSFVAHHTVQSGALNESPDGSYILAVDQEKNVVHLFQPGKNDSPSTRPYYILMGGHPSDAPLTFYPTAEKGVADYVLCIPLTENTNRNHYDIANGEVACDYFNGCRQAETAGDVINGMCRYVSAHALSLLHATIDEIGDVRSESEPFGTTCIRCEQPENYNEGVENTCTCTPFCGSCADDDYSSFTAVDYPTAGVSCFDLKDALIHSKVTSKGNFYLNVTRIPLAGAVYPDSGSKTVNTPQCGFSGPPQRPHKRGGKFDASIANFPANSLQVINMETQQFHCDAKLPGKPFTVIYVPPDAYGLGLYEETMKASRSARIIVSAVLVLAGLFSCLVISAVIYLSATMPVEIEEERWERPTGERPEIELPHMFVSDATDVPESPAKTDTKQTGDELAEHYDGDLPVGEGELT